LQQPVIADAYLEHCQQFVPASQFDAFIAACATPLRPAIRVNTLRMSVEQFSLKAEEYGWQLTPIPWCNEGFWIDESEARVEFGVSHSPEHLQGAIYIQEASSMLPPVALFAEQRPTPVSWVMDMAAAPGSKTTQLAAMMKNRGLILANELSASRLKSLHGNLLRCGVQNTYLSHWDAGKLGDYLQGHFNFVLLDAPCGGEGTVRKDIDALRNWSLQRVLELASLQKKLICSAYQCLDAGGYLVYSTCTLSREENQQVVEYLLQHSDAEIVSLSGLFDGAEKALTPEGYLHILPHIYDSEGFFVALLRKPLDSCIKKSKTKKSQHKKPKDNKKLRQKHKGLGNRQRVTLLDAKQKKHIEDYLRKHFAWHVEENWRWYSKENQIWLVAAEAEALSQLIKLNRLGLLLGEQKGKQFRLSHEAAVTLGNQFAKQKVELSKEQLAKYITGENLLLPDEQAALLSDGETIACYRKMPVGLGLVKGKQLKNNLARHLVMDKVAF